MYIYIFYLSIYKYISHISLQDPSPDPDKGPRRSGALASPESLRQRRAATRGPDDHQRCSASATSWTWRFSDLKQQVEVEWND